VTVVTPVTAPVRDLPVVVIGGGQAGLAAGFYLQRAGLTPHTDFVILDASPEPGGAWTQMWESLRLFSPAQYSSLPGRPMPPWTDGYPPAEHVRAYLADYEKRYKLPVLRPTRASAVTRARADSAERLLVHTDDDAAVRAQFVVSATGTWQKPFWPTYPGSTSFGGRQLHSAAYRRPEDFAGERVVIVGGGNTAAQVLAEVSTVATALWVTSRPPRFMADDVDGRHLFAVATRRIRAPSGSEDGGVSALGDIVMVPPVREARDRGVLHAEPMFTRLTPTRLEWVDGRGWEADTIIWCTGFRPALGHLAPLKLRNPGGHINASGAGGTRSVAEPRLYLLGYGDWTGPASATLIGVGRTSRDAVTDITARLADERAAG
jgi:cation diffusion facilitator CzcD-associated flavoprotein CzcO